MMRHLLFNSLFNSSICIYLFALSWPIHSEAANSHKKATHWPYSVTSLIKKGGIFVENTKKEPLLAYHAQDSLTPASTLKLLTAAASLDILGTDYRFVTDVYTDDAKRLYIKGYGDPMLISEELKALAAHVHTLGINTISELILDARYFEALKLPGVSSTLNPYDALNGALLANFNTLSIQKINEQTILPGEPETPLTPLALWLARKAPYGLSRINLAAYQEESVLYVGELFKHFFLSSCSADQTCLCQGDIKKGVVPNQATLLYRHTSSHHLEDIIKAMLRYSTNFIANQLFLTLGAHRLSGNASLQKSQEIINNYIKNTLHLTHTTVVEGSGIARDNTTTAEDMVKILAHLEQHYTLLPEKWPHIFAKTGTLHDVQALAGYFDSKTHQRVRFAIILNDETRPHLRDKIVQILYAHFQ